MLCLVTDENLQLPGRSGAGPSPAVPIRTVSDISGLLSALTLEDLVIVADVRGTLLLSDTDEGFPLTHRATISSLLRDSRAKFIAVTGDPWGTFERDLLKRLDLGGDTPWEMTVVTGFSHEVSRISYVHREREVMYRGPSIADDVRLELACCMQAAYLAAFDTPLTFEDAEKQALTAGTPFSIELRPNSYPHLPSRLVIEFQPNKVSVFFPDLAAAQVLPGPAEKCLDEIMTRYSSSETLAGAKVLPLRGQFFVDYCIGDKAQGVANALALTNVSPAGKTILVLGDSTNDLPLFQFDFPGAREVWRVLVGADDALARQALGDGRPNGIYLKGVYSGGSAAIFDHLLHATATSRSYLGLELEALSNSWHNTPVSAFRSRKGAGREFVEALSAHPNDLYSVSHLRALARSVGLIRPRATTIDWIVKFLRTEGFIEITSRRGSGSTYRVRPDWNASKEVSPGA